MDSLNSISNINDTMKNTNQIERALVGALASEGDFAFPVISEILTSEMFTDDFAKATWDAAALIYAEQKTIDAYTMPSYVAHMTGVDAMTCYEEMSECQENLPADLSIEKLVSWCKSIAEAHATRLIAQAGTALASEKGNVNERLAAASKVVSDATSLLDTKSTVVDASEMMKRTLAAIQGAVNKDGKIGVQSGLTELDETLAGFKAGELIILAARPAMGKTALALTIAEHVAVENKVPVLVFSLEMGADQLGMRVLSMRSKISMGKLRVGDVNEGDAYKLSDAADDISESPLTIDEAASLTMPKIIARAKKWRQSIGDGDAIIVIDYLTLIQDSGRKGANKAELVGEISRGLKQLARELKVPVICLSQLNRELEKRQDKRPMMSDLRDSGSIEQDADVILFLYRDEVYNKMSPDAGTAELNIGKQRSGSIGTVRIAYIATQTKFVNLTSSTSGPTIKTYRD
jgi:replicative DNA helicase